jgi:hypothetical protein
LRAGAFLAVVLGAGFATGETLLMGLNRAVAR